jgi:hypothetical protein
MIARAMDSTKHGSNLNDTAMLASWPTPIAHASRGNPDPEAFLARKQKSRPGSVALTELNMVAQLTSWPTPTVNDSKGSDYSYGNGDHSKICLKLPGAAKLTGWSTPLASDGDKTDCTLPKVEERAANGKQLSTAMQARLTSWPTPMTADADRTSGTFPRGNPTMVGAARLTSWPTPCAQDGPNGGPSQGVDRLPGAAALTGWATPAAQEAGGSPESYLARKESDAADHGLGAAFTNLAIQAKLTVPLASWATPAARDYRSNSASQEWHEARAEETRGKPLSEQVHQLAGSGETRSGSTAETEDIGQLNPELSRWLMGLPESWSRCRPSPKASKAASVKSKRTATRSTRSAPPPSSEPSWSPRNTSADNLQGNTRRATGDMKENEDEMPALINQARRKALMEKLATAKAGGVGNNFKDGKYRLAVKKMGLEEGFKGTRFQSIFTVVNSIKIPVIELKTNKALDINPNPIGSDVDWLAMDLDKEDSAGPGNMRRLMMDLFDKRDLSDDEYMETLCEMSDLDIEGIPLAKPENAAKGLLIDMETVRIVTKKNKVEIVVPKWSHVPFDSYDQTAIAKWIDDVAIQAQTHQQQLAAAASAQLPAGASA